MRILLVRHAEKKSDENKSGLTKKGIKQAKRLARRLRKIKIDEFYCSSLKRAKETSKIISKKIKIEPIVEDSLNEFSLKTMREKKKSFNRDEKKELENLKDFMTEFMQHPNSKKTILIVAHGFTNRMILSQFFNLDHTKLIPLMQHETCINKFYYNPKHKNWRLNGWNDFNHLPRRLI